MDSNTMFFLRIKYIFSHIRRAGFNLVNKLSSFKGPLSRYRPHHDNTFIPGMITAARREVLQVELCHHLKAVLIFFIACFFLSEYFYWQEFNPRHFEPGIQNPHI